MQSSVGRTEGRAREWMGLRNDRIAECEATLDQEKVYFEAIWSEEQDGRMYLYWIEFKGPNGRPVRESEAAVDQIHLDFGMNVSNREVASSWRANSF